MYPICFSLNFFELSSAIACKMSCMLAKAPSNWQQHTNLKKPELNVITHEKDEDQLAHVLFA